MPFYKNNLLNYFIAHSLQWSFTCLLEIFISSGKALSLGMDYIFILKRFDSLKARVQKQVDG